MKKRSLVSAVAMLVVSAIMLTSATYAWFATGGPAKIGPVGGQAATAGSGVYVKVNGGTWTSSLDFLALNASGTGNYFVSKWQTGTGQNAEDVNPGTANAKAVPNLYATSPDVYGYGYYKPISTDPTTWLNSGAIETTGKIFCYDLDGDIYTKYNTSASDAKPIGSFYDTYDFYLGTASEDLSAAAVDTNDTAVAVNLQITGDAANAARVAVFYKSNSANNASQWTMVKDASNNNLVFSGDVEQTNNADSWHPMIADLATGAKDVEKNYIVDAADIDTDTSTNYSTGKISTNAVKVTAAPAQADNALTKTFVIPDVHVKDGYTVGSTEYSNTQVRVFVWLEGQDKDCTPRTNVPGGEIMLKWGFALDGASPDFPTWS